jgi:hypothetical protein
MNSAGVVDAAAAPRSGDKGASRAAVILGNDAILAAEPSTTAQLAHACGAAGFDIIVPPSWGDELVARVFLQRLPACTARSVIACSCPRVRARLADAARTGGAAPAHVSVASPAVAAARYLRLLYGDALLVTYVGDCPSAADTSIDARFSPSGFLASLHRQAISLTAQPNDASATEMERWRRFESTPGGLPARRYLARPPIDRVVREIGAGEATSGLYMDIGRSKTVFDLAPAAGCSCAADRVRLEETEPARSSQSVVVAPAGLDLSPEPSLPSSPPTLRARPTRNAGSSPRAANAAPTAPAPSRPAPSASTVPVVHVPPRTAAPPRPNVGAAATPTPSADRAPVAVPPAAGAVTPVAPASRRTYGSGALLALPAVVLLTVLALGIGVYTLCAEAEPSPRSGRIGPAVAAPPDPAVPRSSTAGEPGAARVTDQAQPPSDRAATPYTPDTTSVSPTADTAAVREAREDSLARARARARRARTPQVVPGWLPQGQRTFTPIDTTVGRKPESTRPRVPPDTMPQA